MPGSISFLVHISLFDLHEWPDFSLQKYLLTKLYKQTNYNLNQQ